MFWQNVKNFQTFLFVFVDDIYLIQQYGESPNEYFLDLFMKEDCIYLFQNNLKSTHDVASICYLSKKYLV